MWEGKQYHTLLFVFHIGQSSYMVRKGQSQTQGKSQK